MEREDALFKQACAKWHLRFAYDLRKGKDDEANRLALHVEAYTSQWRRHLGDVRNRLREAQEEVEKLRRSELSAARRLRLLQQLHVSMKRKRTTSEKKTIQASGGDNETHT